MATKLTPQRRVLAMAASQIGYSRWTDPNRGTKYARDTQPVFWPRDTWLLANGISFCDLFVTWVFWKALGKNFVTSGALPAGASYNTDYRASKGGRVSKSQAAPGDVLVFDWNWSTLSTNHVGILEKRLSGARFQTIEGNTSTGSSGSQSNGGRVARRVRRHDQVRYVIRPDWSKAGGAAPSAPSKNLWDTSPRIRGMSTADVKRVQSLLIGAGYSVGSYGVDGSYKADTVNAVRKAQKALGVTVDGVAGPDTIAVLEKAQKSGKPAPKPAKKKVDEDGRAGRETISELQRQLGVKADGRAGEATWRALQRKLGVKPVDGKIGWQSYRPKELGNGIVDRDTAWGFTGRGSKGSPTVRALQKHIGMAKRDQDGIWHDKTSLALQRALNNGKF